MSKLSLDIQFKALDNLSPALKEMIKNSEQMSSKLSSIQKDLEDFLKIEPLLNIFKNLKTKPRWLSVQSVFLNFSSIFVIKK